MARPRPSPRPRARAGARAPCRASASGRSSTGSRARSSSAASCSTTSAASCSRSRAARTRGRRASSPGCARESPPLAVVERVECDRLASTGERDFRIVESDRGGAAGRARLAGRRDLRRLPRRAASIPADRRYRYPFINCTNCGPRFTIVRGVPVRPAATTMAGFAMCDALPGRVRGPGRPPLPRPAERLPGVRAAARLLDARTARRSAAARRDAVARGRRAARRRGGARGQGHRRLPPGLRRRRRGRRARAARAQAPRGQAVRADGARLAAAARRSSSSAPAERALLASSARPIVLAPRRAGARASPPRSRPACPSSA